MLLYPTLTSAVQPMVSEATAHTVGLKRDGTVWAWGINTDGELGNPTSLGNDAPPVQVSGLVDVTKIAAGGLHTLALKRDGTVWAWGYNADGRLGDGTTGNTRPTPVQVVDLSDITDIAAGSWHSLALKNDGTVWAWGYNGLGSLGDGTKTNRLTPVPVPGLSDVAAIAVGFHSLALKKDGTVWAWGPNNVGQLGDGTNTEHLTPTQVKNLSDVIAIAAGGYFNMALKRDGTVWTWGSNNSGQLGNASTTDSSTPVQAIGLTGIKGIEAGLLHGLALRQDGVVLGWGSNNSGQIGGAAGSLTVPAQIPGATNVYAISGGGYSTVIIKRDGSAWGIGNNFNGQLGNGSAFADQRNLVQTISPDKQGFLNLGPFYISGASSGPRSALVLTGNVEPALADLGLEGKTYVAARVDGQWYFRIPTGWQLWSGGVMPAYVSGPLTEQTISVVDGLDANPYLGVEVYAGYGLDETDMLTNQKYARIYTVQ